MSSPQLPSAGAVRPHVRRPYVIQPLLIFPLPVGTSATAIANSPNLVDAYIDSIFVNIPSAAANPVFFGMNNVTIATGLELQPGLIINFALNNERQLYELQYPILDIATAMKCETQVPDRLPVVVWDPSQLFLVAAAATDVRIALFKNPYV